MTGALKYDFTMDKLPWDLLPIEATEGMLRVLLYGKRKYTICGDCVNRDGRPTKIYPNPRLNGDAPRSDCPVCSSENISDGSHNWRLGFSWSRLVASSFRHLAEIAKGNYWDPESELLHASHLACCVAFLTEHIIHKLGKDDIFKYKKE